MEAPVFLVGAERSGTTLLRLMLDSHPEISFLEEFEYVTDLVGDDGALPDVEDYGRYLETNRVFQISGFTFRDDLSYRDLVDGFLRSRQKEVGATIGGATIHFGFSKSLAIWPDARFLHIIRDPRDVAPSVMEMGWAGNTWWALNKWVQAEEEWDRVTEVVPEDRRMTVRYADLVTDHVAVLTEICRFLGTGYDDRMLDYADRTDYDLPDPSRSTGWARKLSPRQVRLAEARVGLDRLRERGFEPSGQPPLEVGRWRREWLRWHDRKGKIQARVAVFGLRFTVEDLLARATGNDEWQRRLAQESAEVVNAAIKRSWAGDTPSDR